jgi:adenine-specific DNA-methyltransferase
MTPTKVDTSHPKSLAGRPAEEADLLGQVNTPSHLAYEMAHHLLGEREDRVASILDPCAGPFTFPLAILDCGLFRPGDIVTAIDVDPKVLNVKGNSADLDRVGMQSIVADYLDLPLDERYDYAILNPPYVRQEWLDKKVEYQRQFRLRYGLTVPGTSNLYVYFMVKVLQDLKPGGRFACIVYDAWQSTLYGRWLLAQMQSCCETLRVEAVSSQPFRGRMCLWDEGPP